MNLLAILQTVSGLCTDAGELLKTYSQSGSYTSSSKGGMDFVTEADIAIDDFLKKAIQKNFPESEILTEETAKNPFDSYKVSERLFVVDPIDGTTNYSRGDSHCAISVGLVDKGKPVLGVVYLPLENKRYEATRESDALCNGEKISVSDISDMGKASIGFDFSWNIDERKKVLSAVSSLSSHVRQPRSLGCASADICLVAEGKLDGYINYGLKPWDIAAASLILQQAGGVTTKADSSSWNVFDSEFLGTNSLLHSQIVSLTG